MGSGSVLELVALLNLLPLAVAYLHHGERNHTVGVGGGGGVTTSAAAPLLTDPSVTAIPAPEPSYFTDGAHSSLFVVHVATMVLAWLFMLPIGRATSVSLSADSARQAS